MKRVWNLRTGAALVAAIAAAAVATTTSGTASAAPAPTVTRSDITIRTAEGVLQGSSARFYIFAPGAARATFFAPCLPGEKAIAGGWTVLDSPVFPDDAEPLDNGPAASPDGRVEGWQQTLLNYGDTPLRVRIYASCADAAVAGDFVTRTSFGMVTGTPNGANALSPFLASCAPGEKVVAGGWSAQQSLDVTPFLPGITFGFWDIFNIDEYPVPPESGGGAEGWHVNLVDFGGDPVPVTVVATCLRADAAGNLAWRQAQGTMGTRTTYNGPQSEGMTSAFAGCGPGEKVVAGGWSAPQPGVNPPNVFNRDDQPTDTANFGVEAWNVVLYNYSDVTTTITVYASCFA